MNRKLTTLMMTSMVIFCSRAQSLINNDLPLYNVVTDKEITIDAFDSHAALVLVFTSIHCPYAKLYKDRIASMSDRYANQNVRFILVNANVSDSAKKETVDQMKTEAGALQKVLYFADKERIAKNTLQVEKNPEAIILKPSANGFRKIYQGAIDDSPQSASQVRNNYIQMALENLLANQAVSVAYKRPVGCMIR